MTAEDLPRRTTVCDGFALVVGRRSGTARAAIYDGQLEDGSPALITVVDGADGRVLVEFVPGGGQHYPEAPVLAVGHPDGEEWRHLTVLVERRPEGHPLAEWVTREPVALEDFASTASSLCILLENAHEAGRPLVELWPSHVYASAVHGTPILSAAVVRGAAFVRRGLGIARAAEVAGVVGAPIPPELARGEAPTAASDVYCLAALLKQWLEGGEPQVWYGPLAIAAVRDAIAPALDPDPAKRPDPARLSIAVWDACRIPHPVGRWRRSDRESFEHGRPPASTRPAGQWEPGDVVEAVYRVEPVFEAGRERAAHESGGMGLVYRMHHLTWRTDLAVKVPRPELFQTEAHRTAFEAEVDTWVRLGLHPHVVDCHYLRRIDGLPCVFTDYRAGGTLAAAIAAGTPYEGGDRVAAARVLDVAIQTAWGLAHAHRTGVVHQDVKPGNVLLDGDVAQVSDFGLSQALGATAPGATPNDGRDVAPGKSIVVPGAGGMTPAYASPEQFARAPLTTASDVWSWAVMVLELLCGDRRWLIGPAAPESLLAIRAGDVRVKPPRDVEELLASCLAPDPAERRHDLADVAAVLRTAWERVADDRYPRDEPEPAAILADGLSNEALSMIDLGRDADAEDRWQGALAVDPRHPHAVFNQSVHHWRRGALTDDDVVNRVEDLSRSHRDDPTVALLLGLVHAERGDTVAASAQFDEAARAADPVPGLDEASAALETDPAPIGLQRRFVGSLRVVRSVAITADGEFALAGGWGGVELWHLPTGVRAAALGLGTEGGGVDVRAVAIAGTGTGTRLRLAYAGHLPGGVRVDVANVDVGSYRSSLANRRDHRRPWSGSPWWLHRAFPAGRVEAVAFDASGTVLAVTTTDRVDRYDVDTGELVESAERGRSGDVPASTDAAGRWKVTIEQPGVLRLWDVASQRCVRTFREHRPRVRAVALAPSGEIAVSGDDHGLVCIWQLPGSDPRPRAPWSYARPRAAREVSESAALVTRALARAEEALAAGDARGAGQAIAAARAEPGWQRDPALVSAWRRAGALVKRSGLADAWLSAVRTAPVRHALETAMPGFRASSVPVDALATTPDGRVAVTTRSASLQVWIDDEQRPRHTMSLADAPLDRLRSDEGGAVFRVRELRAVAVTADGSLALTTAQGDALRLWDLEGGNPMGVLGDAEAHSVAIDAAGSIAVSAGWRSQLDLWDVAGRRSLGSLAADGVVGALALGTRSRTCVTACARQVTAWDLDDRSSRPLEPCGAPARTLAITPDGRYCAVGLESGAVELFHVEAGRRITTMDPWREDSTTAPAVAIADDGWIVVASSRHRIEVWTALGDRRRTLEAPPAPSPPARPLPVAISGDASTVFAGDRQGALVTWTLDWTYDFGEDPR